MCLKNTRANANIGDRCWREQRHDITELTTVEWIQSDSRTVPTMPRFAGFHSYFVHFSFLLGVPLQKVQDPSGTVSYRPRMIGPIQSSS